VCSVVYFDITLKTNREETMKMKKTDNSLLGSISLQGKMSRILVLILFSECLLFAQSEAILKKTFEGKTVVMKIDMPASKNGVDVYPQESPSINYGKYAQRLKDFGTAVYKGDSIIITTVKVKKKNIEFQLGGGGYGTARDETVRHVDVLYPEKTTRERDLEKELETETDKRRKRRIQEDLDRYRDRREREYQRRKADEAQAEELSKERIHAKALAGGSRFNLWYHKSIPASALTPDSIMKALAKFVEFPESSFPQLRRSSPLPHDGSSASSDGSQVSDTSKAPVTLLHKGMSRTDVDTLLGRPNSVSVHTEGSLKVTTCVYRLSGVNIKASFVGGLLVQYTVSFQ